MYSTAVTTSECMNIFHKLSDGYIEIGKIN